MSDYSLTSQVIGGIVFTVFVTYFIVKLSKRSLHYNLPAYDILKGHCWCYTVMFPKVGVSQHAMSKEQMWMFVFALSPFYICFFYICMFCYAYFFLNSLLWIPFQYVNLCFSILLSLFAYKCLFSYNWCLLTWENSLQADGCIFIYESFLICKSRLPLR